MSKLAKDFTKVLRDQIRVYAAWLPVTNTIQVGDYGIIDDGVFMRMGSIKDNFGIDFDTQKGESTKIDFASKGSRMTRFAAGSQVDSLPEVGTIDANLKLSFSRENSFFLKAELSSSELVNVHGVAMQLARHPSWERNFKVVSITYATIGGVLIATQEKDTEIELSAKADVLKKLEMGSVDGEVGFSSNKQTGFKSLGAEGVIGLRLFRIKRRGNVDFLKEEDVEIMDDFGDELPSDIH